MSHPLPTDVRIRYVHPRLSSMRDLYQAWLEPEHRYLGVIQKRTPTEWAAYRPNSYARPDFVGETRTLAGEFLREAGDGASDS